jgi:antitoxin CcdA
MADHGSRRGKKKATNVSLSRDLLDQAQALGVGVSEAAERGLAQAIREARTREWQEQNREAIDEVNAHVQAYGLPLERYRQF